MLRLRDPQMKLWDSILAQPELLRLPDRLKDVDRYLDDDRLMAPFLKRGQQRVGRPTVPMERYLRLMFLKHERGLGYETLVQEVADSITLRRFVRLDISDPVPHPTTLSRLTQRFGEEASRELHSSLVKMLEEEGFVKGDELRTDTTVMEADVEHPTDAGLLADGVRVISRTVGRLAKIGSKLAEGFRNSTRTAKNALLEIGRFLKMRATAAGVPDPAETGAEKSSAEKPSGEDKKAEIRHQVNVLTAKAFEVANRTVKQARTVAKRAKRQVARASEKTKRRVARICAELVAWSDLTQRALDQTKLRLAGQTSIPNRMVSLFDPDARPIRRGKLSSPTEFGYKVEVTQVENLIISDYKVHVGNPADSTLLVGVVDRHVQQFGKAPKGAATDRGYHSAANEKALKERGVEQISMPATGKLSKVRAEHQAQGWFKRLQRWRAGSEGSISNFKRRFGGDRSRLKGHPGASNWVGWGVFAHNLTKVPVLLASRAARRARALAGISKKDRPPS